MWRNEHIMHLLRRVYQSHSTAWRSVGIQPTPVQFGLLLAASQMPNSDQRTLAHIAAIDEVSAAELVRRMCDAGLLSRRRNPADRRAWLLTLTTRGQAVLDEAFPRSADARDAVLHPLTPGERAQLHALLLKLSYPAAPETDSDLRAPAAGDHTRDSSNES